ncbi:MAG: substrate-binding domain-containing protein [Candidatus Wenzhouxiangella sp. M2_3B_020]
MKVELEIRWRIGPDQADDVDPLLFRLLEAIQQGDNLRAAARRTGVSYRHAWGLLQYWEKQFGAGLVLLERGRGASMLPLGQRLLAAKHRAAGRLAPTLQSLAAELEHDLIRITDSEHPVRISASHDIALQRLVRLLNDRAPPRFNLQHHGSTESLRHLAAGRCEIAGFHVPVDPPMEGIHAEFRRLVPASDFEIVHFACRRQGLILPRDNPDQIRSLTDVAERRLSFVNRQQGSGTRLLFDALLAAEGISADRIVGYETEEFTHQAVAAMVASEYARVGFGIAHAAAEFGLHFIPLATEHYLLAWQRSAVGSDWHDALERALGDHEAMAALSALPGYDFQAAGETSSLAGR